MPSRRRRAKSEEAGFDLTFDISDLPEAPGLRVGADQQGRRVPPDALRPGAGHRDCDRVAELRGDQDPACQHLRRHQGLQGRRWPSSQRGQPQTTPVLQRRGSPIPRFFCGLVRRIESIELN